MNFFENIRQLQLEVNYRRTVEELRYKFTDPHLQYQIYFKLSWVLFSERNLTDQGMTRQTKQQNQCKELTWGMQSVCIAPSCSTWSDLPYHACTPTILLRGITVYSMNNTTSESARIISLTVVRFTAPLVMHIQKLNDKICAWWPLPWLWLINKRVKRPAVARIHVLMECKTQSDITHALAGVVPNHPQGGGVGTPLAVIEAYILTEDFCSTNNGDNALNFRIFI